MNQIRFFFIGCYFSLTFLSCSQNDSAHNKSDVKKDSAAVLSVHSTAMDSIKKSNLISLKDISPMDMSYCPSNYPFFKMQGRSDRAPWARVIYSRPHKKGRLIFGDDSSSLCRFGLPWRMGANEATEIEFFSDAVFNDQEVKKGRYVMYCIPYEKYWDIRLNSNLFSWGLHIDSSKDVLKTDVQVKKTEQTVEDMSIFFMHSNNYYESVEEYEMIISWDRTIATIPIHWKIQP